MKLRFKDDDIIKMNNEVAMNDNKKDIPQAQLGIGLIPYVTSAAASLAASIPTMEEVTKKATDVLKNSPKLRSAINSGLSYVANTDWGKEKLKNFANNIDPHGYGGGYERSPESKSPAKRIYSAAILNKKEPSRKVMDSLLRAGQAYPDDSLRVDLINQYAGLPQKYNTLKPSQYTPTMGDKNQKYFNSPILDKHVLDDIDVISKDNKVKPVFKTKQDLENFVANYLGDKKQDPKYPDDQTKLIPNKGKGSNYVSFLSGLGSMTYGIGEDEKGHYLSYYDNWDLNPYVGAYASGNDSYESQGDKLARSIIGNEKENTATKRIGTPTNVYNRIYFDKKTGKPKMKKGGVIKDDMGQWAHPGEVTEIDSNDITMQGVDYPVLGISDTGDTKMMQPGEDYKFDGEKVTEYPMKQNGGWLDKFDDKAQEGKDIPKGYTLPTVTVTSSKPSKWGNMKFAPYDPSNQPTISQWNPKPGEREAMAAAEQARKDEENSFYNNKHIKALRNSAFADWRPYAIAGGLTALPAIGSALGLGSTGAAMSTPIAAGITANHLLGAYFVKQGINNLPETSQSVKTAYNDPTSENITNAINDVAWNTLDLFPAASTVSKIGKEAKGVYNTIATGESALPIAWKSKANTSSSNYVDDLITSGRSYLEQKAGEKLAGAENRKAIAEGNKWFEDWANHPETAKKIKQQIIDQKILGKNNPEIFDRIDTPETMQDYRYITTYKPGATEYPLTDQTKDLIKTILGKNKYRTPMIHGDNSGVSYRHGLSPWTSNTTSMDYYTPGDRLSGPGTWISRDPFMNQAGRKSVTIHENTHDWLRDDALTRIGYKDEIQSHLSQEAMDASTKWIESGHDTKKHYLGYLADPTEVHARIMQARHHFGLTPTDKVTSEMAESMLQVIREGKTPINKQFADIFSSPKGAAKLFNKLPAIAPVAVGVGAAATTLPKEQKNGGWLNKYK